MTAPKDVHSASAKAGMGAAAACEHKPGPNEIIVCIDKDIFSSLRELAHEHPSIKAERGRLAASNAELRAALREAIDAANAANAGRKISAEVIGNWSDLAGGAA